MVSSTRNVWLIDARISARPTVVARLVRDCPSTHLDAVEQMWAHARESLAAPGAAPIEHAHWNWRNKAESVAAGLHRLVGLECEGEPQGLMAILQAPRPSHVANRRLVYVDYVESAPWNLRGSSTAPRFLGVGTLLIADAVRLSLESGLEGAIGLHSLPQAEPFYSRIGMTRFGPDPDYHGLAYFEYDAPKAVAWLASIGEVV